MDVNSCKQHEWSKRAGKHKDCTVRRKKTKELHDAKNIQDAEGEMIALRPEKKRKKQKVATLAYSEKTKQCDNVPDTCSDGRNGECHAKLHKRTLRNEEGIAQPNMKTEAHNTEHQQILPKDRQHKLAMDTEAGEYESDMCLSLSDSSSVSGSESEESESKYEYNPTRQALRPRYKFLKGIIDENSYEWTEELKMKLQNLDIVIDWDVHPLHRTRKTLTPSKIEEFRQQGIEQKTNVYDMKELLVLIENWRKFKKEYGISNPLHLLGTEIHTEVPRSQKKKFLQYLARGLETRTLLSVYMQARHLLHPQNYQGMLSIKEVQKMHLLREVYGNKWAHIARLLGRSNKAVINAWVATERRYRKGPWTAKEEKRLIHAVIKCTGKTDVRKMDHHGLPWGKIKDIVRTRNEFACRTRWMGVTSMRLCDKLMSSTRKSKWGFEEKIKLLKHLKIIGYELETDIPWDDYYKAYGFTNCAQLRSKYCEMRRKVPYYHIKSFAEQMDWLIENYLPILEQKMKEKQQVKEAKQNAKNQKEEKDTQPNEEKKCEDEERQNENLQGKGKKRKKKKHRKDKERKKKKHRHAKAEF